MKRLLVSCWWVVVAVVPARAFAQGGSDTTVIAVDRLFDRWRGTDTPGCAVGVSRNGQAALERAYGMANLETGTPIRPATIFHAASIAKQVTALAVMLLVQDGRLNLDDDVHPLIPELPDYGVPITARQLFTHTSGVRDYIEMLILARGRFEEDRITRADAIDIISRQAELNFPPGTEYLYSNSGYVLLAILVERVSGMTLRDFAAERIFRPLGMTATLFRDDYTMLVPGRAVGYAPTGHGWRLSSPNYDVYGPTNLLTTVTDLLRWLHNFDEPTVGNADIIRAMTTPAMLANGDVTDYGFGISLAMDRGAAVQEHEGADPGFRAYVGRYVQHGLGVAILCNTRAANAVALGHDVAGIYLDSLLISTPPYVMASGPVDDAAGSERGGIYFQPRRVEIVELSWHDGGLYTSPRGGRRLVPLGNNRFQVAGFPIVHAFGPATPSGYVASTPIPGHHPVEFEWRERWSPTREEARGFAGEYVSPELATTYRVVPADSTLKLEVGSEGGLTVQPVFRDTFRSGQIVVEFFRNGAGRVSGFALTHPRARRIRFHRIDRRR